MKKLLSLCLVLTFILSFSFIGCDNSGKWQEVQSITYYVNNERYEYSYKSVTLTSFFYLDSERIEITQAEYEQFHNSDNANYPYIVYSYQELYADKKEQLEDYKECQNKTYYFKGNRLDENRQEITVYYKLITKKFVFYYVSFRTLSDGSIELKYYDKNNGSSVGAPSLYTKKVLPTSYEITYFNN